MSKTIALVSHCGPDSSYLRMVISKAVPGAKIVLVEDAASLKQALDQQVDLLLFNRELGYGFDDEQGVEAIRRLHAHYPRAKMMLVSNYPDAQAAAMAAGALPGFGKRELGSPRVIELMRSAVAVFAPSPDGEANDAADVAAQRLPSLKKAGRSG